MTAITVFQGLLIGGALGYGTGWWVARRQSKRIIAQARLISRLEDSRRRRPAGRA